MKARDWQKLFSEQARLGKHLFTTTELANAAGLPRRVVNVEMTRLVAYGLVQRYARGLYGLPGSVTLEQLVSHVDPCAYITGAYALMRHGLVTQVPAVITVFSPRRHSRREVPTPEGRIEFVCVRPPIYQGRAQHVAGPESALLDFVYLALRRGMDPGGLVTFRKLGSLKKSVLARTAKRYPATVQRRVAAMVAGRDEMGE